MRKPKKTPPTFSAREWVPMTDAFLRIMSIVGPRDLSLFCINRDLRSGQLRSMKILPDGTMTLLKPSDWERRTVEAPLNPQEGVRVEPYVDGQVYVRRADLNKHYPLAGSPTMTAPPQSDGTESSTPTSPAPERQKPGVKPRKDWPNRLLAPEIVRVAYETPDLLLNRPELVRHVRNFLDDQMDWEPSDNKRIHLELDRLLSRIK